MPNTCSACKHPQVREINHRIREQRPYEDISRWLSELAAKDEGFAITRQALARHVKAGHVKGAEETRERGRKPVSGSFLQAVVTRVHEAVENDELTLTVRDGISAQAELNRQSERSADRDLMAKIALLLSGAAPLPMLPDPENEAIEAEFRPLLTAGEN